MHQRLADDGSLFRGIVEAAPDALVVVDRAGTIVLVNEQTERVFGYARTELLGQRVEILVPRRAHAAHARHRSQYVDRPDVRPMANGLELTGLRRDGTEFPAEISLAPLDTDEGVLVSAAVRDMSDRLHLRKEHDRMREQVIATVSHELRTPLTSILGYAELMEDLGDDEVGPGARRLLGIISRNAARELQLVEDLLTLAFIGEQRMTVRAVPTDLGDVARRAVAANRDQADLAAIELVLTEEALVPVLGEAHRLRQVVEHLVGNALKFTPTGGRIEVRVRDSGSMALLEVEDTGMGVPADELPRVFERLYRARGAVEAQVPGAGLGLPITKAIVEAHAGWIEAESRHGEGTLLRVALPYAEHRVLDDA